MDDRQKILILRQELDDKEKELEKLHQKNRELKAKSREIEKVAELTNRLLGILRRVENSATWQMGWKLNRLASSLRFRTPKAGFAVEVARIERELSSTLRSLLPNWSQIEPDSGSSASLAVNRRYPEFDRELERRTVESLASVKISDDSPLVSIIMPTHNREHTLPRALDSVVAQRYSSWELIIVDDGSTDNTQEVLRPYLQDSRVSYKKIEKSGVGTARNRALDASQGSIITFLDSDNEWYPDYLYNIVRAYESFDDHVLYTGIELYCQGQTVGYRGDDFDYSACLEGNYIDLNCFSHRAEDFAGLRFDHSVKRYNDWDYILTVTKAAGVRFIPFVGVRYYIDSSKDQISSKESVIYRELVRKMHTPAKGARLPIEQVLEDTVLNFLISCSDLSLVQPSEAVVTGLALRSSFQKLGHISDLENTDEHSHDTQYDVFIAVCVDEVPIPPPGVISVVLLNHVADLPALDLELINSYDLLVCGSESLQKMLSIILRKTVLYMPAIARFETSARQAQATSSNPSQPDDAKVLLAENYHDRSDQVLGAVANSGLDIDLYGTGWANTSFVKYLKGTTQRNDGKPNSYSDYSNMIEAYAQGEVDLGQIRFSTADALEQGIKVYLHSCAESRLLPSNGLSLYGSENPIATEQFAGFSHTRNIEPSLPTNRRKSNFLSFAEFLMSSCTAYILNKPLPLSMAPDAKKQLRIAFFPQVTKNEKLSSSAYIRTILPLTSDLAAEHLELKVYDEVDRFLGEENSDFDVIIISRVAIKNVDMAERIIAAAQSRKTPLIIDVDDGFHLIDESHSEFDLYSERLDALRLLFGQATQVWASTKALRDSLVQVGVEHVKIIENCLDPRLWRQNTKAHNEQCESVGFLYMGSRTHLEDLHLVLPDFDRLHNEFPGQFSLTVIGVAEDLPARDWIRVKEPPSHLTEYPMFANWLLAQASKYDAGIAPLVNTPFNALKSDLKALEYMAMGLDVFVSDTQGYRDGISKKFCSEVDWYDELTAYLALRRSSARVFDRGVSEQSRLWSTRSVDNSGNVMLAAIREALCEN
ncbi:MAG: glycosyltransferase [Acidiferrobacterales bacterium]|nr:glycosyltransferase [Acidiferrobacterales bacterium]